MRDEQVVALNDSRRLEMAPELALMMAGVITQLKSRQSAVDGGAGSLPLGVGAACEQIGRLCADLAKTTPVIPANGNSAGPSEKINVWVTPAEAAELVGLTVWRITQLCRAGTVNARRHGRRCWLVEMESVYEHVSDKNRSGAGNRNA